MAAADADGARPRGRGRRRGGRRRGHALAAGDEVVLSWAPSCGECADCRRGRPAACLRAQRARSRTGRCSTGRPGCRTGGETVYRGTATGLPRRAGRRLGAGGAAARRRRAARAGRAARLRGADGRRRGALRRARRRLARRCSSSAPAASASSSSRARGSRARRRSSSATRSRRGSSAARRLGATHVARPDDLRELMQDALPGRRRLRVRRGRRPARRPRRPSAGRATAARRDRRPAGAGRSGSTSTRPSSSGKEKRLTGTIYGSEDPAVALPVMLEHVRAGRLDLARRSARRSRSTRCNDAVEASLAGEAGRVLLDGGR